MTLLPVLNRLGLAKSQIDRGSSWLSTNTPRLKRSTICKQHNHDVRLYDYSTVSVQQQLTTLRPELQLHVQLHSDLVCSCALTLLRTVVHCRPTVSCCLPTPVVGLRYSLVQVPGVKYLPNIFFLPLTGNHLLFCR